MTPRPTEAVLEFWIEKAANTVEELVTWCNEAKRARARAEEARLLEEVAVKDERIAQCARGDCDHGGSGEECLQDLAKVSP